MSFWRGFVGGFGWIKLLPLRPLSWRTRGRDSASSRWESVQPDEVGSEAEPDDDDPDERDDWNREGEDLDDESSETELNQQGPIIEVNVVDEVGRDLRDFERGLERVRETVVRELGQGELVNQVDELLARVRSTRSIVIPRNRE